MLFTLLLFKNSIQIFYLFVHSSTVSCILKLVENRTLRCENSENLSLITLNIVWLTVVQKTFVSKIVYLFVHSSTVSCILKIGENRSLRCENSENLSLITSNSVWLTVVQKIFVFKFVYLFVHRSTVSCIVFGTLKKFSKCQVGGEVRNTFTTEPVYTHFPPVD